MKTYKIVFIDDGINDIFFPSIEMKHYELKDGIIIIDNSKDINDTLTHGTICLGVFLANVKMNNFVIYSLKILDSSRHASSEDLRIALEWSLYQEIDLINLSIGSSYFLDRQVLKGIINQLYYKQVVIIAAQNNNYCITYPASFSNVIGVMALNDDKGILLNPNYLKEGIEICAKSEHKLIFNNRELNTQFSNSFAVPYVTADVLNTMNKLKTCKHNTIIKNLCSIKEENVPMMFDFDWCSNAYFIVAYEPILKQYFPFGVFDVTRYIGIECENNIKKNVMENGKSIDTLVIIDYKNEISAKFINYLIMLPIQNLIFFSPLKLAIEKYNKSKYIFKNSEYVETFYLEDLNAVDVPIICIYMDYKNIEALISCLIETRKEFFANGYHCKCLSNYQVAVLYDIEVLDEFEKKYFEHYIEFYNIDIFVIGILRIDKWKTNLKPDIEFNLNEIENKGNASLYNEIIYALENDIMEE